jgi:hypothetical protein
LALQEGWFPRAVEAKSPTAAFELAFSSTGDEELAKSCRFAALLKRDYGMDMVQLVQLVYSRTKEATTVAVKRFKRGTKLDLTTTALEIRAFVGTPGKFVANKTAGGLVIGEDDRFVYVLGQELTTPEDDYEWIMVDKDHIVTATINPTTLVWNTRKLLAKVSQFLPRDCGWDRSGEQCLDESDEPVDQNLILEKLWEGYQASLEQ